MSMISAQIDELRERAKVLRQGRWSDGADDARLLEDAADTIWQLRDDLQRTNAENAKLRELGEDMLDCIEIRAAFGRPPTSEMYERFADAARELGMEVD